MKPREDRSVRKLAGKLVGMRELTDVVGAYNVVYAELEAAAKEKRAPAEWADAYLKASRDVLEHAGLADKSFEEHIADASRRVRRSRR